MDDTVRECRNAVQAMDAIAADLSEHVG